MDRLSDGLKCEGKSCIKKILESSGSSPPAMVLDNGDDQDAAVYVGTRTLNAALDLDMVNCPVCSDPLSAPIYQCSNGHLICSLCCHNTSNKCPSCSKQIGEIRCLVIEKLIESLLVSCTNARFGCSKKLKYAKKTLHESKCPFSCYACPICGFLSRLQDLSSHFMKFHLVRTCELPYGSCTTLLLRTNETKVLLKVRDVLFLLYNNKDELGNLAFVKLFGPYDQEMDFIYHLAVAKGKRRLSLESHPRSILAIEKRVRDFLFIPMLTYVNEDSLEVEICIRRAGNDSDS